MSKVADVVHISDLHFVENLTERGRRPWYRRFTPRLKSHAFGRVRAFSRAYKRLSLERGSSPDVLLVTGDLCTDGTQEALATCKEFLELDEIRRGTPGREVVRGLNFPTDRRVILPGNHDRYTSPLGALEPGNDHLERTFDTSLSYPYTVGFRRPAQTSNLGASSLIFFVFDSTASIVARQENSLYGTPAYGLARGRIEPGECDWLTDEAHRIATEGDVTGLDGEPISVRYDSAVRIAVLHHHPIGTGKRKLGGLLDWTTVMENSEEFVKACLEAKVDLVLFGHQHQTFAGVRSNSGHRTYFLCCPSTAEYSATDAGFYWFAFHDDHFEVKLFRWQGTSFLPNDTLPHGMLDVSQPYYYSR